MNDDETKPTSWYVDEQVSKGKWKEETVPAAVVGLSRPLTILRAPRKDHRIMYSWHGDQETFCPPTWSDLAIGSGACGLGCRACFLVLTHRAMRDPWRHLLYNNLDVYERDVMAWLKEPGRRPAHTLGVGIDRSDSLLYEGVAPHVRTLAPIMGSAQYNPQGCRLILLTKTANVHYLDEIAPEHRSKIVVSFSLNPPPAADLWEGVWPDTGERIPPSIEQRLQAARAAQEMGYTVRARIDPILYNEPGQIEAWYGEFVDQVRRAGINFDLWTLGMYREKNAQLEAWCRRWGLPHLGWAPMDVEKDGTHYRVPAQQRAQVYTQVIGLIHRSFPGAQVGLCKETHAVRKATGTQKSLCNCL